MRALIAVVTSAALASASAAMAFDTREACLVQMAGAVSIANYEKRKLAEFAEFLETAPEGVDHAGQTAIIEKAESIANAKQELADLLFEFCGSYPT